MPTAPPPNAQANALQRTLCLLPHPHPRQANNVVVREWGEKREEEGLKSHYDLVQMLDIVNMEAGTAVSMVFDRRRG